MRLAAPDDRLRCRAAVLGCLAVALAGALATPAAAERTAPEPPVIDEPIVTAPAPPELSAASWVLMDAATGQVLAEHDADRRRPVASTIKILTALSVVDRADLDERVTVGEEVVVGGASVGLRPGDEWTVEQLLDGLVARSGNDAAEALATHVAGDMASFVGQMADDAAALGLEEVVLTEASGLDDGNELSATDLAVIARVALSDPDLRGLFDRARVQLPRQGEVASRNELLEAYPGATGMKTGYTAAAGFSLVASAERGDRELIAVLLAADEDPARFQDAIALLDHGFDDFAAYEPSLDWTLLVAGGRQALSLPPTAVVVPDDAALGWEGLPPPRPVRGAQSAWLTVDGLEVAELEVEIAGGPEPVAGTAALGRALVDEVYAGLRAAGAQQAW